MASNSRCSTLRTTSNYSSDSYYTSQQDLGTPVSTYQHDNLFLLLLVRKKTQLTAVLLTELVGLATYPKG